MKRVIGWFFLVLALGNIIWWIIFPGDFSVITAIVTGLFLFGWYRWTLRPLRKRVSGK